MHHYCNPNSHNLWLEQWKCIHNDKCHVTGIYMEQWFRHIKHKQRCSRHLYRYRYRFGRLFGYRKCYRRLKHRHYGNRHSDPTNLRLEQWEHIRNAHRCYLCLDRGLVGQQPNQRCSRHLYSHGNKCSRLYIKCFNNLKRLCCPYLKYRLPHHTQRNTLCRQHHTTMFRRR